MKKTAVILFMILIISNIAAAQTLESSGYIVRFNMVGPAEKFAEITAINQRNIHKYESMFFLNPVKWYYRFFVIKSDSRIREEIEQYASSAEEISGKYLEEIRTELGLEDDQIGNIFEEGIYGATLYITPEQAKILEKKEYVQSVTPNLKISFFMSDTIGIINADDAWGLLDMHGVELKGDGVKVAILDSGFDLSHQAFSGLKVYAKQCFCTGGGGCCAGGASKGEEVKDNIGHGTHVLGTIGSQDKVYRGIAPSADFILVKIGDDSSTQSDLMRGMEYALSPGKKSDFSDHADVVSISMGMIDAKSFYEMNKQALTSDCRNSKGSPCSEKEIRDYALNEYMGMMDPIYSIIRSGTSIGMVFVVAAGNSGMYGPGYISPFSLIDEPIVVGASTKNDGLASYSSTGPAFNGNAAPDILAPGGCICPSPKEKNLAKNGIISAKANTGKCILLSETGCDDASFSFGDGKFISFQGTSMATPHASGVSALLKQKHPGWNAAKIEEALRVSAVDLGFTPNQQGAGRIDAFAALAVNLDCPGAKLMTDVDNCGECGNACYYSYLCFEGVCEFCGDGICNGDETYTSCPRDCVCIPDCENKECGDDGCGTGCGTCANGEGCYDYGCISVLKGINIQCEDGECTSWMLPSLPENCVDATYGNFRARVYEGGFSDEGGTLIGIVDIEGNLKT